MKSLRELKGIGEKTERLFEKLGIQNVEALLRHYPRGYQEYEAPISIRDTEEDQVVSILGRVSSNVMTNNVRSRQISIVSLEDGTGKIQAVWYHAPYIRNVLKRGNAFVFRGRIVRRQGRLQIEQPEIYTPMQYKELENTMQPVYSLTAGLSNKTVSKTIRQALQDETLKLEFIPEELRERLRLAEENFAMQTIHFPRNREELLIARRRLVFDEFLLFVFAVQGLKERSQEQVNDFPMKPVWHTERIIEQLPYTLTEAQKNVWHELERDLTGHTLMSRLVQGDVGSGKTILAFLGMVLAAENGYQATLMVPTEVLARQHFESMSKLLCENDLQGYSPVLLTGSQTAKEKREIYKKIASGETKIIIGTHALIQEQVVYDKLGLVITDEQHRFGVKQRESLMERGSTPHVLVMSATPIPRTLAMILYGDLDISIVDQMPASRIPIKNCVVDRNFRPKAYRFIQNQVEEGHQAYIICPMVEESENLEVENVTDYTEQLRQFLPSSISVGMLHGKMRPKEKNAVMEKFSAGEIQVLVSTTVVEVGVNVPNATVMMVENAERFGLAQLHQLRGRVGRDAFQSYCIFIQGNKEETTSKRLKILNESNDGFFIAGEDLKLRGPGDVFGIRQSGLMEFRIGDIYQDADILKLASESAGEILSLDPLLTLPEHQNLKKRLTEYCSGGAEKLAL